ncbi:class Ib ribonucleoside-diphosphate reductase assembly flavoprotein NrdI [Paracoccus fistulariae]|uniref:Protein NrdI n=1 Tax=Paracoccus fistulariae TaxID=658446 RepID=A0ABY7SMV9_9RHOB|nr:class Ib ribonucleoside-diphosphate reductase assembly flavoprotein NrdI [Paracoccus fistulariae]MDB6180256.1 class Ib ribonucleoside-diphosphate reductase assembly flavoprotein NrdI [Paracoccus fistulariae]WCR08339.1 class Ib ribonucleoside-diphosphate reductase assembly flavoprotein NrdI [Paracoccus fistulariae]
MADLVYFSSASGNTARFITALAQPAMRIPVSPKDAMPQPRRPFVLVSPTFADGEGRGAVPKQVIRFLNDPAHRALLRGVIGAGNRNFGATFALAARVIAEKCKIPVLYRFELAGTETDVLRVRAGLEKFRGLECLTV